MDRHENSVDTVTSPAPTLQSSPTSFVYTTVFNPKGSAYIISVANVNSLLPNKLTKNVTIKGIIISLNKERI